MILKINVPQWQICPTLRDNIHVYYHNIHRSSSLIPLGQSKPNFVWSILIGLSHIRVSTHVSTAYRDTKGTSHVRRRYVGIRSSYSSIRSSYSSYAEVLRFLCVHLKIRSTYVAGPIRSTYVTHTWYIRKQRGRYVVDT